jgi:hypothetical protein
MDEFSYVYATAGVILLYFVVEVVRKRFDPFAPVWLFLIGYVQVYVVQALSYHEYAIRVRGLEVTTLTNLRALWAICWFLLVYSLPIGRAAASRAPRPPTAWSSGVLVVMVPILIAWGLAGALLVSYDPTKQGVEVSAEAFILLQFPIMTLVAAILLIITGRNLAHPRPLLTAAGLALAVFYVFLWMYNGKRSHSLIGVLTTICALYCSRGKRPSFLVLALTALIGASALTLAIGWRNNMRYDRSLSGFVQYLGDFDPQAILTNINMAEKEETGRKKGPPCYETEELGGTLLMMDTVPHKSPYDYGASYLRIFSTFIPRVLWPDKPYYGREEWVSAWIAGSEFKRDKTFTGPAIGILGALQLNGGATGTAIVMAVLAVMLRTAYEYFRRYADCPWAQAWWTLTFYNAWFMTVNDDPMVWFYYIYGFTTLPPMVLLWVINRMKPSAEGYHAQNAPPARIGLSVRHPV